ncbi:MAG: DNA repair protein RecO [Lactobacillales bacterium]|jgi:DNA repair protein RecO (recombination protein O)|nr:DNA repair protein RecO [Lactobacillales bacterium]
MTDSSLGIVLSTRDYQENDALVKIFTLSHGKKMFLVRGVKKKNSALARHVQPGTVAMFNGKFNFPGLSYLNSVGEDFTPENTREDFEKYSYAIYFLELADKAIEDDEPDAELFHFLVGMLRKLDDGEFDPAALRFVYEMQLLKRLGVEVDFGQCAICGAKQNFKDRTQAVEFDFNFTQNVVGCAKHFDLPTLTPRAAYALGLLQRGKLVKLSAETKEAIRTFTREYYDAFVGIKLKSRDFLDNNI